MDLLTGPTPGAPALIGLPYDGSSSFLSGAADAPPRIREALWSPAGNPWTETGVDLGAPGALHDAGDVRFAPGASVRESIEGAVARLLEAGFRPLALGGDHSVTYPVLRAMRRAHPRLTVLHVDAHADLYHEFQGDPYSHACPFARAMEEGLADRLVQVGVRTLNGHQREQARRFGVEVYDMRRWAAGERPTVEGPVHLSIDLDGLDPAFAPGVSHREPGGLTVREVLALLHSLPGPVVGADVVEYNPRQDVAGITAPVAAKLVKEIAGMMLPGSASEPRALPGQH